MPNLSRKKCVAPALARHRARNANGRRWRPADQLLDSRDGRRRSGTQSGRARGNVPKPSSIGVRVRGNEGLSDRTSVMPFLTASNTNIPTIMIAEKGRALLRDAAPPVAWDDSQDQHGPAEKLARQQASSAVMGASRSAAPAGKIVVGGTLRAAVRPSVAVRIGRSRRDRIRAACGDGRRSRGRLRRPRPHCREGRGPARTRGDYCAGRRAGAAREGSRGSFAASGKRTTQAAEVAAMLEMFGSCRARGIEGRTLPWEEGKLLRRPIRWSVVAAISRGNGALLMAAKRPSLTRQYVGGEDRGTGALRSCAASRLAGNPAAGVANVIPDSDPKPEALANIAGAKIS